MNWLSFGIGCVIGFMVSRIIIHIMRSKNMFYTRKIKVLIAGVLIASAIFSLYAYNITCKPEEIHLRGTIAGIWLEQDTAIIQISSNGKYPAFRCYLTSDVMSLYMEYNETTVYDFYLTKSKSDRYYHLSYEEVEKNESVYCIIV